uniref:Uncharacterized protein n=1 Tax=Anopheles atroparvus TaxID=41427 RepID=A0A182J3K0_ANOAO
MSIEPFFGVLSLLFLQHKSVHSQLHSAKELAEEYFDESEVPNLFDGFNVAVSDPVKARSWEHRETCHFPNANGTIRLENIREGLWIPLAYLRHSDNHLHPFVSPYGPLRCLRAMTRYDPNRKWLSLRYGCRANASFPWRWDFLFEFLPNKRILYRNRYGCSGARQLRRTVIAATDHENYLVLHGCQSNADHYMRANGLMVLVRTFAPSRAVHWAIGNYTRQVLQPQTELTYLNRTADGPKSPDGSCNCSVASGFVFCDPKYRFRRDPELVQRVNATYYRWLVLAAVVALLMTTLVLVEQLYTFQSTMVEVNYTPIN